MKIEIPSKLKALSESTTFPIYIVGGYVRESLSGLKTSGINLTGPVAPLTLNLPRRYKITVVDYRLGTAIIECNGDEYEYTPFRVEKYSDSNPNAPMLCIPTGDVNKDALRRDFTINSIYYDIKNDDFIDPLGGIADLEKKIIRAYNPQKAFAHDGIRIMRLVRIACQTGFKIEGETAKAAMKFAESLKVVQPERKRDELDLILKSDTKYGAAGAHYRGIKLLHKLGLNKYIIPKIDAMEGVLQNPKYHKYDVLEHTFQTVKFAPPEVRLAALLHDIGKPYCVQKFGNMHGHEAVSANIAAFTLGMSGLRYPNNVIEETVWLCKNHMCDMAGETRVTKLRLFAAQNYDKIDKLTALMRADKLATGMVEEVDEIRLEMIKKQLENDGAPLSVQDLKIDATMLISEGIQAVKIGGILDELWRTCVLDPKLNNEVWLLSQIKKFAEPDETFDEE